MSYSELVVGPGVPNTLVPTLAPPGIAPVPGYRLKFDVEEPEMFVTIRFQGTLDGAGIGPLNAGLLVDGVVQDGGPLISCGPLGGLVACTFTFERTITLSKGSHTVQLMLGDSTGNSLVSLTYPNILSIRKISNGNVLPHGVDAKDKGIF